MTKATGLEGEVSGWKILHLPAELLAPASRSPRLEIRWRNGVPVSGKVFPSGSGEGYPHPVAPAEGQVTPQGSAGSSFAPELRLSVVIPTCDREEDLARCLASFAAQSRPPDQLIVVDNASRTEGTRKAAETAGVAYVLEARRGLDLARNAGILAADGNVIAFCDDDVVLHPDWSRQILATFTDPGVDAATGLVLPLELETPAQRTFELDWSFGRGFERIDYGPAFFARTKDRGCPAWIVGAGASMAFRREVFERVGLFDERLDAGAAGCSGDSEMWYRVLAAGGTCRYEPRIVSYHRHRQSMDALRRQIRAYMRGHVVALLVQYQRYRQWGDLRRAFLIMPRDYLRRGLRRLRRGRRDRDMLGDEVAGFLSGFAYFARHRRLVTLYPPAKAAVAQSAAEHDPKAPGASVRSKAS